MIWTHDRSIVGKQGISIPVSLLAGLLGGLFSNRGVGVMRDKNLKPEDLKASHTLCGGVLSVT